MQLDALNRPCVASASTVTWGGTDGRSIGIAKDVNFASGEEYLWASIRSGPNVGASCGGTGTEYCLGAARIAATSTSPTRHWVQTPFTAAPVAPDVVGVTTLPKRYLVGDKTGGGATQYWHHDATSTPANDLTADQPSQLAAVSSSLAIATDAGDLGCAQDPASKIRLLDWTGGPATEADSISQTHAGVGGYFKPEGVYVRQIAANACADEPPGKDFGAVAYVIDYCGADQTSGRVLVIGINETSNVLTLTDSEALPSNCHPSTVTYHPGTGKLFVLCQTGETIIPLTLSEPCEISAEESAVTLRYVPSGQASPACGTTPSMTSCAPGSNPTCTPHDFSWINSPSGYSDWLLVSLDGVNQITRVKASDPTVQGPFYGVHSPMSTDPFHEYEPTELELVSVP